MVVFRPDSEATDVEDECFTTIYTKLKRAKEGCSKFIEDRAKLEPELGLTDFGIDWMKDESSTPAQEVWFGRVRAEIDGNFYLYEMKIEL